MPETIANTIMFPTRPPRYWVAAKRRLGMSDAAFGRIWYHIYTPQKRMEAWLAAPEDEWQENGLRRP